MLSPCLVNWSQAIDLHPESLHTAREFCVGFVRSLAGGEKLQPCLVMEQGIMQLMQTPNLLPELEDRGRGLTISKDDLAMQLRGSGHDYPKCHALGSIPFGRLGSISGACGINDDTGSIGTTRNDTYMVSDAGKVGNDLDLPVAKVVM